MPKILIAEDDVTMVSLLTTLLKLEGFEVVELDAGSDVPLAVDEEKPDTLLMDVHLGKQSGMEIVKQIRNNPINEGLNIVMTSGMNLKDECLKHGADHFILKPFMPDDLIRVVRN